MVALWNEIILMKGNSFISVFSCWQWLQTKMDVIALCKLYAKKENKWNMSITSSLLNMWLFCTECPFSLCCFKSFNKYSVVDHICPAVWLFDHRGAPTGLIWNQRVQNGQITLISRSQVSLHLFSKYPSGPSGLIVNKFSFISTFDPIFSEEYL